MKFNINFYDVNEKKIYKFENLGKRANSELYTNFVSFLDSIPICNGIASRIKNVKNQIYSTKIYDYRRPPWCYLFMLAIKYPQLFSGYLGPK